MNFYYNDDSLINEILSGSYSGSPDAHAIFIKSPINYLLQFLYSVVNTIPWYTIFLLLCIIIPFLMILYNDRREKNTFLCRLLTLSIVIVPALIQLSFTTTAAALVVFSLIFFFREDKKNIIASAVLLSLSYCIRSEVFIVGLAFFMVAVLWKILSKQYRHCIIFSSVTIVLVLSFFITDRALYSTDEWAKFQLINDNRVKLYDYTWYIPYENAPELYVKHGITYDQYLLIDNYAVTMDDCDWAQIMQDISVITEEYYPPRRPISKLIYTVIDYVKVFFQHFWPLGLLTLILYIHLFASSLSQKKWSRFTLTVCLFGGRCLIWIYLLWRGRFPERVFLSISAIEIILLTLLILDFYRLKGASKPHKLSYIALAVATLSIAFTTGNSYFQQSSQQKDYVKVEQYMQANAECFYLLDVRSFLGYSDNIFSVHPGEKNSMMLGGWYIFSPTQLARLENLSTDSPYQNVAELFVRDSNVVLILSKTQLGTGWLEKYMAIKYPDVKLVVEDTIYSTLEDYYIINCN